MDFSNKNIGNNLLTIIKKKKFDPSTFSDKIGLSMKSLGRIFDGRAIISDDMINKIVTELDISQDELYAENDDIHAYHRKQFDSQEHCIEINQIINDYINLVEQTS